MKKTNFFSLQLKKMLAALGLKQKQLAQKTGVVEKTIGRWVNGQKPPENSIRRIAKATGVSVEWLTDPDYGGPMLEKNRWAYEQSARPVPARQLNGIYERISEIMKGRGMTREHLVLKAGINTPLQSAWPWLGDPPSPYDIEKIADATGYNRHWIWTGEGSKFRPPAVVPQIPNETSGRPEMADNPFLNKAWAKRMIRMLKRIEPEPRLRKVVEISISEIAKEAAGSMKIGKKKPGS